MSPGPVIIYVDNKSAIDLTSKHIDMRFHFIKDCVERGEIEVKYVRTQEQRADRKFEEMRVLVGVKKLVS